MTSQADSDRPKENGLQRSWACHLGRGRACAPWQPRWAQVQDGCLV